MFCPHRPHNMVQQHGMTPWMDLGDGAEAKIQLFQNMVMLHIKLNLIMNAATW